MLREDNVPPMNWSLGRVTDVHAGSDGIVRVVTIRTEAGTYKRSVSKICPLPSEGQSIVPLFSFLHVKMKLLNYNVYY